MGVYRYAIYHSPKINVVIDGKSVTAYPLCFFCNDRDLAPTSTFGSQYHADRYTRLQTALDRIYDAWGEQGPEYCFHMLNDKAESESPIYHNPKRIVSFHDGGSWPLVEIGSISKQRNRWIMIPCQTSVPA